MFTARTTLRKAITELLEPGKGFSKEERLREALLARRCRNVFFNAIAPVVGTTVGPSPQVIVKAQTPQFAQPIILTDLWNYNGDLLFANYWDSSPSASLLRLFSTEDAGGLDFFGQDLPISTLQVLTHYRNALADPFAFDVPGFILPMRVTLTEV